MIEGFVKTAFPLTSEDKIALETRMTSFLNTPVSLTERLDKTLIAGITVEIAGRVMDYSLKGRLAQINRGLMKRGSVHDA